MYGLLSLADLSPLLGQTLDQVCVGEDSLILKFSDECQLSIESDVIVRLSGGEEVLVRLSQSDTVAKLIDLIGEQVVEAKSAESGELYLLFPEKRIVRVLDSNVDFESYTLQIGSKTYIV